MKSSGVKPMLHSGHCLFSPPYPPPPHPPPPPPPPETLPFSRTFQVYANLSTAAYNFSRTFQVNPPFLSTFQASEAYVEFLTLFNFIPSPPPSPPPENPPFSSTFQANANFSSFFFSTIFRHFSCLCKP